MNSILIDFPYINLKWNLHNGGWKVFTQFTQSLIVITILLVSCTECKLIEDIEDTPQFIIKEDPPMRIANISIITPNNVDIDSKDVYVDNCIITFSTDFDVQEYNCGIKGRGNSTWVAPKKPYVVKLNNKAEVMGYPIENSFVLLANYLDTTMIKNDVAMYMGRCMSKLDYTPKLTFVRLTINDHYLGIYQFCEKIKLSESRVTIKDGFLLEVDGKAREDELLFNTEYLKNPINIKSPAISKGDANYQYVYDYFCEMERVLYSDYFLNKTDGYKKYMDIDSFVEWYLINEIAKNNDAQFYTSCFMTLQKGGKLKMGPLWDFDVAFGGYPFDKDALANNPQGFHIKNEGYYQRLFQDPEFVAMVKNRYNDYYDHKEIIFQRIEQSYELLKDEIYGENQLWGQIIAPTTPEGGVLFEYRMRVDYMKQWLIKRMDWLYANINAL